MIKLPLLTDDCQIHWRLKESEDPWQPFFGLIDQFCQVFPGEEIILTNHNGVFDHSNIFVSCHITDHTVSVVYEDHPSMIIFRFHTQTQEVWMNGTKLTHQGHHIIQPYIQTMGTLLQDHMYVIHCLENPSTVQTPHSSITSIYSHILPYLETTKPYVQVVLAPDFLALAHYMRKAASQINPKSQSIKLSVMGNSEDPDTWPRIQTFLDNIHSSLRSIMNREEHTEMVFSNLDHDSQNPPYIFDINRQGVHIHIVQNDEQFTYYLPFKPIDSSTDTLIKLDLAIHVFSQYYQFFQADLESETVTISGD